MALVGPTLPGLYQWLVLQHYVTAATNKMRQPADYLVEGPGSSVECQLQQGLDVVAAIIPIIAYGLLD